MIAREHGDYTELYREVESLDEARRRGRHPSFFNGVVASYERVDIDNYRPPELLHFRASLRTPDGSEAPLIIEGVTFQDPDDQRYVVELLENSRDSGEPLQIGATYVAEKDVFSVNTLKGAAWGECVVLITDQWHSDQHRY